MRLSELLNYKKITIQCHDNPDADAIASGYALYCYLHENNINASLVYCGNSITKDNLRIFVEELGIPIENISDHRRKIDGLLITVDCQYSASNVTLMNADEIMIIDHHQQEIEGINKTYIMSNLASCSTFVWMLLKEEKFDFNKYPELGTALYYGLYTDSGQFANVTNPLDKDMLDALKFDGPLITRLQNSNISSRELEIAAVAMIRANINTTLRYAVVKSEPCDPNILGLISDFVLQVSEVDYCIVYNETESGIKFSTRSCVKEVKANHLAQFVAKGVGSGGGHMNKAGGFIYRHSFSIEYNNIDAATYFSNMMNKYINGYEIVDVLDYEYDLTNAKKFFKKKLRVGYVDVSKIVPVGTEVTLRTLEGDMHLTIKEDTYIMIGIKGEIHPISKAKFEKTYELSDEPYDVELEYHPRAKIRGGDTEYTILEHAKSCYTTGTNTIYAKPLTDKGAKVFTEWDRDCYMLGEPGDYLVARCDDTRDVYIIEKDIFGLTYEEVKED